MRSFQNLVDSFLSIINAAIPLVFALTIAVIIWKVAEAWVFSGGDPAKIEQGKKTVLIAVVVLTIMTTVWGIVSVLQDVLY